MRALYAASIAAVGLIGLASGMMLTTSSRDWTDYVAAYQALYSSETLADVNLTPTEKETQLARITSTIAKDLTVADLDILPEITYTRAQLLRFQGEPLVQLAFRTSTGTPFALCIMESVDGAPTSPHFQHREGLSSASWTLQGYQYLLIGGTDDDLIARLAHIYSSVRL